MSLARDERALLCDLFTEVGPDAPTLCGDWTTRDLAAHLVVRERRLDAAPGLMLKPFAGHTARVQAGYARRPWTELVEAVRTGPPLLSPFRPAFAERLANTTEYYVHHEDVRRAAPGWEPRPADAHRDRALWAALRGPAKVQFRSSPVGVVLRTEDGESFTAKSGPDPVSVVGAPGELLMDAFGRAEARVRLDGTPEAVAAVRGLGRGV